MNLLILGAGQYGRLVFEVARDKYNRIDFLDDNSNLAIGKISDFSNLDYDEYFVAIGDNALRKKIFDMLVADKKQLATIISDKAYVAPSASIGMGSLIEPFASVCTDAKVGFGVFVSSGAVVNHNSTIGDFSHIDCGAIIGSNAVVKDATLVEYGEIVRKTNEETL